MGNNHPPHIGIIGTPQQKTTSTLQELLVKLFENRQVTFSDNLNLDSRNLGVLPFDPKKQITYFDYNGISLEQFMEEYSEEHDVRKLNYQKYFPNQSKEYTAYSLTPNSKKLLKTKTPSNKIK